MRGVVRRAAPPFPAVLNKFIFKGSRGEYVSLLPQEPENVLRPGLICRRQQIDKSTKFGLPWPTRSHPPAPPRPTPRAQDQVATLPLSGRGHPPHRPEKNRRPPRRVLSQGAEAPHSPQSLRTQAATRAAPQEHVQRTPEADGRGTQGRAPGTRRVRAQALAGRVRQPGPPREMRRRVVHHGPTRRRLHGQRAAVLARVRPEVDGGEWLRARPAADGRSMREPLPVPLLA
ncbi:unnamed protein product [Pelagomonas calceolata]|uniref:Uncharacterized protein n=1 Tax=Pelagomonas calceolata TaxID=35677 RepID=A0A8J2WPA5_9STRA|nr:unnamed protein product [Pelagomonas calceolata]